MIFKIIFKDCIQRLNETKLINVGSAKLTCTRMWPSLFNGFFWRLSVLKGFSYHLAQVLKFSVPSGRVILCKLWESVGEWESDSVQDCVNWLIIKSGPVSSVIHSHVI